MRTMIPAAAGQSRLVREKRQIRGRSVRVAVVVFTTHDGYVGEALVRHNCPPAVATREAYEAAVAERARAQFQVRDAAMHCLPKPWERCDKPAPAAQLLTAVKDTLLFSEVERRGFEVAIP